MRIVRIHRITLAVHDARGASRSFEELFDVRAADPQRIAEFGVDSVDLPFGDTLLQLVSPATADFRFSFVVPNGSPVAGSPHVLRKSMWPCAWPVSASAVSLNRLATST